MKIIMLLLALFAAPALADNYQWQTLEDNISPTNCYWQAAPITVVSTTIFTNGKLEIVYRQQNTLNVILTIPSQSPPPHIWKDIYSCKDGKIILEKTVQAIVTPEHTVPEKITWPED